MNNDSCPAEARRARWTDACPAEAQCEGGSNSRSVKETTCHSSS